jgi:hypothetical protein
MMARWAQRGTGRSPLLVGREVVGLFHDWGISRREGVNGVSKMQDTAAISTRSAIHACWRCLARVGLVAQPHIPFSDFTLCTRRLARLFPNASVDITGYVSEQRIALPPARSGGSSRWHV